MQAGVGGVLAASEVGIAPNDSTRDLRDFIEGISEDLMVVGHLPFMERMVSHLLAGTPDAIAVAFEPGTVVSLDCQESHRWALNWMIRPSLLAD